MTYSRQSYLSLMFLYPIGSGALQGAPQPPSLPSASMSSQLPHGIREVALYPFTLNLWWIIGGALLLVVFCSFLYWLWKRTKKKTPARPQEDPIEVLYRQIKNFYPEEPFTHKEQLEYYFQLSMYFRKFIELTTQVSATDCTVGELVKPLRYKIPKLSGEADDIIKFLRRFDMIKFAEVPSHLEEARQSRRQVLQWVKKLRPQRLPNDHESQKERVPSLKT